jgi:4-oxalocrotonate tautomerase
LSSKRDGAPPAGAPFVNRLKESTMPIVTIQVTREGTKPGADSVTAEEKTQLIKGVSHLLRDVLNKPLEATFVVIEENWGWGGLPVDEYRRQRSVKQA